jgi:V/A-type H+-transporting ATPase subunit E
MDSQLKELIETIKSEGVESAEKQASQIVEQAEERAKQIVSDAENRADEIVRNAEQEAARREQSEKAVVEQAGRDLLLTLEKQVTEMFRSVVTSSTAEAYSQQVLEEAIVKLVSAWAEQQTNDITVLLSEDDYNRLEQSLRKRLADALKQGADIKPSGHVHTGFRITEQGGTVYYDFSAQGIAEALSGFLNPRLSEVIKSAAEKAKHE